MNLIIRFIAPQGKRKNGALPRFLLLFLYDCFTADEIPLPDVSSKPKGLCNGTKERGIPRMKETVVKELNP